MGNMDINLDQLSSLSGWQRLAEIGMSFGTNLLAALAIFLIGKWIVTYLVILMKATLTRAKVDRTLVSFLGNVANVGLLILVIIAALGKLGIPIIAHAGQRRSYPAQQRGDEQQHREPLFRPAVPRPSGGGRGLCLRFESRQSCRAESRHRTPVMRADSGQGSRGTRNQAGRQRH